MFKPTGASLQVLASACMYIGQMSVGFSITWSGPSVAKLQDLETSPLPFVLTETQVSLLASLIYAGAIPGPFLVGWLSNTKGRKPCFLLGGVFGIIGYILLVLANTVMMLYFARLIIGLGVGCLIVMILVYIGEIASTYRRGVLLTIVGLFTTAGSVVLYSIGFFLSYHATAYAGLALFTVFTLSALLVPESPMYHVLNGNNMALRKILQDLGRYEDIDEMISSKNEYRIISSKRDWIDLFTLRSNQRALFLSVSINVLQHCTGVLAVVFFSSMIFKIAGSSMDGNLAMIVILCFQLLGSGLSSVLIERIGRRIILYSSSMICSLAMFILGLYFYLLYIESPVLNNIKWLPIVTLAVFFVAYDLGIGIIPNVLVGEMFTSNSRTNGSSVALTSSWAAGFLITTAFGWVINRVGAFVPFWFFSASCGVAFLFTIYFIPETKGKSLLEIQKELGRKNCDTKE